MGIFGNKHDGVQEFATMRRVLGGGESGSAPAEPSVTRVAAPASDGREAQREPTGPPAPAAVVQMPSRSGATAPENCASVVSAGSTWEGSLKLDGSVRIDGQLTGNVDARDTVHISEEAQVDASIKAGFVVIAGTFSGQVQCDRLELLPTSQIRGDLSTRSLMIQEGAFIDGQIHMINSDRPTDGGKVGTKKPGTTPTKNAEVSSPIPGPAGATSIAD
ncbi:MAG TPA: polymer-forming cytoskeletal protein [Dehalococcoidia bacterium]|nr:polymer-forming cytoskeletal protein [Dehalococcoidia bacterium]